MDPTNPLSKQQIKDLLYHFLYDPLMQHLHEQLSLLIQQNSLVQQADYLGFSYKGEAYVIDSRQQPIRLPRLVSELRPHMDAYLKEVKHINCTEIPFVLGFITQVLNSSNALYDYLRVLPECLHPPIQKLIDSCNCRTEQLSEAQVDELQRRNQIPIELIKQRLMLNLLE